MAKKKQPTMNDDLEKYKDSIFIYDVDNKQIYQAFDIEDTNCWNHSKVECHHFIPKSIRKNSPEKYEKIEHLQKLILMPKDMHRDVHSAMRDERFFAKWGIEKSEVLYR